MDQIEYSVQQAHAYVEKGVSQLEKAKTSQKSARKVKRTCAAVHINMHFMLPCLDSDIEEHPLQTLPQPHAISEYLCGYV